MGNRHDFLKINSPCQLQTAKALREISDDELE